MLLNLSRHYDEIQIIATDGERGEGSEGGRLVEISSLPRTRRSVFRSHLDEEPSRGRIGIIAYGQIFFFFLFSFARQHFPPWKRSHLGITRSIRII